MKSQSDDPVAGEPLAGDPSANEVLANVKFGPDGLVAAIAQDASTGSVLMLAWMNETSLRMTLSERRMVYWSRSRKELWRKGDTSGDHQVVLSGHYDCDGDALLFLVEQHGGGACHTGARTCFFRSFDAPGAADAHNGVDTPPWFPKTTTR